MRAIYTLIAVLLFGITAQAQEEQTESKTTFKHFSVQLNMGYKVTIEYSKIPLIYGEYDMGNSLTVGGSVSWYYNPNWSLRLGLSTGKHRMTIVESQFENMHIYRDELSVGSVWLTPVSLSVGYHLRLWEDVVPYVSLGGSYMFFGKSDPGWAADKVTYKGGLGGRFAIGTDYKITDNLYINGELFTQLSDRCNVNLDFSKSIKWDLKTQVRPHHIGLTFGIGYRF